MFQPAVCVAAGGVAVRPVDDAALPVPFVFTVKADGVARFQAVYSGGKVGVVGNKQRLSGGEFKQETLVARAFGVVGQDFGDDALPFYLYVALAVLIGLLQNALKIGGRGLPCGRAGGGRRRRRRVLCRNAVSPCQ